MALVHTARLTPGMVVETRGVPDISGGDTTFSLKGTYRSSKSYTCQAVWSDVRTLPSGGTETLDLTALTGADVFPDADFTGFRLVAVAIDAPSENVANITFDVGASNGYNFLGTSSSHLDLQPDGSYCADMPTGPPVVSSTAKTIDVAGTAGDDYDILLATV